MERRVAQVKVGGQNYKVVTTAPESELNRLASKVEEKIAEVTPRGRPIVPQTLLLAAIALAHELEEERARREALERRTRDVLRRALVRIDDALDRGEVVRPQAAR